MIDGIAMTKKFNHLADALQFYDYEFYNYLKKHQADDLLFCYRWLLLEMKREFAFEDSLRMLEVLWSSLPPNPPEKELQLFEKEFAPFSETNTKSPPPLINESPYTKVCALRRQNSAMSISHAKLNVTKRMNQSLDETRTETCKQNICKTHQSLDENKLETLKKMNDQEPTEVPEVTDEKTESPIDDISEKSEKNPFLYSDSTDADLPTGSSNSSPEKTIVRGNSLTETLKELREKLVASKIGIMNTLDQLENDLDPKDVHLQDVKLVKNFNEFLSFAKRSNSQESDTNNKSENNQQLTVDRGKL